MTSGEIEILRKTLRPHYAAEALALRILTALEESQVALAEAQSERDRQKMRAEEHLQCFNLAAAEVVFLRARLAVAEKLAETLRFIADENNSDVPTKRTAVGHLQSVADAALREWDALSK